MAPPVNPLISTFSGGEVTPLVVGRPDLQWYPNACQKVRNFVCVTEGAATRRPATRFVQEVKDSTALTKLRRFLFSVDQAYMTELGDQYVRFYSPNTRAPIVNALAISGAVNNGGGLIRLTVPSTTGVYTGNTGTVAGVTGTTEANGTRKLNTVPVAMTVTGAAAAPGGQIRLAVNATAGANASMPLTVAGVGGTTEANGTFNFVIVDATHIDLQGTSFVNAWTAGGTATAQDATHLDLQASAFVHAYVSGGTLTVIVEVPSRFRTADLTDTTGYFAPKFVQSEDVLFIFHGSYPVTQLKRYAHTHWQVEELPFDDGPYLALNPTPTTLTPSAPSGNITLVASSTTGINPAPGKDGTGFQPTDIGRFYRLGYIPGDWKATTVYALGDTVKNGANGVYICRIAGTSAGSGGPTGTGFGIGDNTVSWDYLNAGGFYYGYVVLTGVVDPLNATARVINNLGGTAPTTQWRPGLYSGTSGYPVCGDLWQQRMHMAGPATNPDRIDSSATADYPNFTPGDTDDDALAFTLGLETGDPITWLANKRTLFLGTSGSVQKEFGASGYDSAVTPGSIEVVEQVKRGSANLAPVRIVNGLVYLHRMGRKLLELYYDFTLDIDTATELTARSRHITASGIRDMDYQQEPYSMLCCQRGDGNLAAVTYYREQQVMAWHLHSFGGAGQVEAVACVPGQAAAPGGIVGGDQTWLIVKRTINGVTRRYVEVMDDFAAVDDAALVPDADLFFGDCYAVYTGAPTNVVTGLGYLEGLPVVVIGDGITVPGLTVTGGQIQFANGITYSKVYVGLDYSDTSSLMPMPIEPNMPNGTPMGATKKIDKITVGLYRSGRFTCGDGEAAPTPEDPRTPPSNPTLPTPLTSKPYQFDFNGDLTVVANMEFKPVGPEPLTLTWLVPRIASS